MLKDAQAILAMLKGQVVVLEAEDRNRVTRDDKMIATIKEDAAIFHEQMEALIDNLTVAIKRIEGPEDAAPGIDA